MAKHEHKGSTKIWKEIIHRNEIESTNYILSELYPNIKTKEFRSIRKYKIEVEEFGDKKVSNLLIR